MIRINKKQSLFVILFIVLFIGALSLVFINFKINNHPDIKALQNNYPYTLTCDNSNQLFNTLQKYPALPGFLPAEEILKTKSIVNFLSEHGISENSFAWIYLDTDFKSGAVATIKNKKINALLNPLKTDTSQIRQIILNDGTRWFAIDNKTNTFFSQDKLSLAYFNKKQPSVENNYKYSPSSGLASVYINNTHSYFDKNSPFHSIGTIGFEIKENNNTLYFSGLQTETKDKSQNRGIASIPQSSKTFNNVKSFNLGSCTIKITDAKQGPTVVSIAIPAGKTSGDQVEIVNTAITTNHDNNVKEAFNAIADAPVIRGPYLIKNHIDQSTNIIAFDNKNQMYLWDDAGNLKWKNPFPDAIKGELFVVDKYNNGKVQLLWNSEENLHLIDINGNEVKGYPYKLPMKALKGISCLQLKGNSDPNIFYCDINGAIRNLSLSPAPAKDWNITTVDFPVTNTVKYQYANNGHYIIVAGNNGEVAMLNKKGQIRLRIKKSFVNNPSSEFYLNKTNSKGFLLTTSNSGEVIYIPRKGNISKTKFSAVPEDHYFLYTDFDNDRNNDFIYITNQSLTIYNRFKKVIYSATINGGLFTEPKIIEHRQTLLLAITDATRSNITLHSKNRKYEQTRIPCDGQFSYDENSGCIYSAVGKNIYKTQLQ